MLDILKQFEAFLVIISLLLSRQSMVCKNKTDDQCFMWYFFCLLVYFIEC